MSLAKIERNALRRSRKEREALRQATAAWLRGYAAKLEREEAAPQYHDHDGTRTMHDVRDYWHPDE